MAFQSLTSPNFGNFGTPNLGITSSQLGSLETKWHLDVAPVANHKEYYKWEGGGFPKSGLW
jgi:hypothetical protein